MPSLHHILVAALLTPLFAVARERQQPLWSDWNDVRHIAIIGAGMAGASAALHLHLNELERPPFATIVIYESEPTVGGRIQTIPKQPDVHPVLEDGATYFYTDDWCLMTAMRSVGLKEQAKNPFQLPRSSGVWDGVEISMGLQCNVESLSWWHLWKYGLSPWRYRRAVESTLSSWKSFASLRTFDSLTKELDNVGLDKPVLGSAESYLRSLGVTRSFHLDFVQPCTRAQFSQDLTDIRGFAALMATRPSRSTSILDGNNRLVERMIKLSNADLRLSSRVTKISPGHHRRYRLSVSHGLSLEEYAEFDAVILAAPLQSSRVDFSDLAINSITPLPPYTETHVTQFTTTELISPTFFNLPPNTTIPDDIFTASTTFGPDLLSLNRSKLCIIRGCSPGNDFDECDECDWENHYRILSHHRICDSDLVRMMGQQLREGQKLSDYNIFWAHRHAWQYAFPKYQKGHALLDRIEIAPQLFYLGGADDVFSSMEMSCRMGRNAAGMLYHQEI